MTDKLVSFIFIYFSYIYSMSEELKNYWLDDLTCYLYHISSEESRESSDAS